MNTNDLQSVQEAILKSHEAASYNIGNVYEKVGTYYIAVDRNKLITFKKGKFVEVKTTEIHASEIDELSVGDLCEIWGCQLDRFDKVFKKYFQPDAEARAQARKRTHQLQTENETILVSSD